MKKMLLALAAVGVAFGFAGCSVTNTSDAGTMNLYPELFKPSEGYRPIYEVDMEKKVSGTANVHVLFGIFSWGESKFADNGDIFGGDAWFESIFPSAKKTSGKAAFYKACAEAKCDAVLAARYEIVTKDYFVYQNTTTTVTGYPAFMKKLEKVKITSYILDGKGVPVILKPGEAYTNIAPKSGGGGFFGL